MINESIELDTEEFPGFPTDLQAQMMVLMSLGKKKSIIRENIFENRFMHVSELNRMGGNIEISGKKAIIHPCENFFGAQVMATDLRASVSLVLAGLVANGETTLIVYTIWIEDMKILKLNFSHVAQILKEFN